MKRSVHISLLCFTLSLVPGTLGSQTPPERLVWPSPPERARIELLFAFSGKKDIGAQRSFLGKIWDWIVGVDEQTGSLVQPMGIAVDAERVYVTDPGARCVHVFDLREKEYETIHAAPSGTLRHPVSIAIGGKGTIFVTDSERREVIAYDRSGDVLFSIKDRFQRPTGIAVHNGRLYVVDTTLHKVFVFSLKGQFLFEFGSRGTGKGEFNFPVFLTSSEHLYLVDAMNHRVQVLDDSGKALTVFGQLGNVQGTFASPKGIAVDRDHHVYVADALFDAFQIFDKNGKLLLVVGAAGNGRGEFSMPSGMFVDDANKIYVVETLNRRVQVFQYLSEEKQ